MLTCGLVSCQQWSSLPMDQRSKRSPIHCSVVRCVWSYHHPQRQRGEWRETNRPMRTQEALSVRVQCHKSTCVCLLLSHNIKRWEELYSQAPPNIKQDTQNKTYIYSVLPESRVKAIWRVELGWSLIPHQSFFFLPCLISVAMKNQYWRHIP